MSSWFIGRLARYVSEWNSADEFSGAPVVLNLPVTDRCNARCVMCDVWKNTDIRDFTPSELRQWARQDLLRGVAHVGVSGGEPTLRKDLPEVFEVLCGELRELRSISFTSHGFHPKRWRWMAPEILEITARYGVPLRANVSVDGVASVHDRVRRIPDGFDKVEETLSIFTRLGIPCQLQCTVSRLNVFHVSETLDYALDRGLDIVFRVATEIARLGNVSSVAEVALSVDERSFFADFLLSDKLMKATRNPARRLFYRDLARRLETNGTRRAPCSFQRRGVMLSATGDIYQCSIAKDPLGSLRENREADWMAPELLKKRSDFVRDVCPQCVHDQSGHWSPMSLLGEVGRRSRFGTIGSRAARAASLVPFGMRMRDPAPSGMKRRRTLGDRKRALLIGAYGGEHVGDAAILAGICQRLHREEGIRDFTLVSFRPGRSSRWMRSISLPDGCTGRVRSFEEINAEDFGDLVCYAGGPLMDLPLMNLRAAMILHQARSFGSRVWVEGVGIGPFRRTVGQASVKAILSAADRVTVRTPKDFELASALGTIPDGMSDDPAEDYIRCGIWRGSIPAIEQNAVDEALGGGAPRPVIAWNLRPLSWVYAVPGADIERVGMALRKEVATAISALPAFRHVLFAMNADQYGDSDLDEIRKLVPLVIGEEPHLLARELGVGGMLALLSQVNVTVAMRFHACVFTTAVGRPVIGIDYGIGQEQKVTRFMEKKGKSADCRRADLISADWLINRVTESVMATGEATLEDHVDGPSF